MSFHRFRTFSADTRGSVAIILALVFVPLVTLAGGAVDYARWLHAKTAQQAAIDSAVLAAARTLQVTSGDATRATNVGASYYESMKSTWTKTDSASFDIDQNASMVRGTTRATITTPFLNLSGIGHLTIVASAQAALQHASVAGTNLEISMMIDLSNAMSGQRLTAFKTAAEEFIDVAVWKDQDRYTSKVALVPFSERVNVGAYASAVTGLPEVSNGDGDGGNGTGKGGTNKLLIPCVTDRHNTHEFDDESPANGSYVAPYDANSGTNSYSTNGKCTNPTAEVVPLTNDRSLLFNEVRSLQTESGSAGQLGTAWSWYVLSPEWQSIWPSESRPAPYSHITTRNPNGLVKLRKVAILVTAGDFDTYKGKNKSASWVSEGAATICQNMKAKGIEVFTITVDLPSGPTAGAMQACATGTDNAYQVELVTGEELRSVMRDIVLKVSPVRMTM